MDLLAMHQHESCECKAVILVGRYDLKCLKLKVIHLSSVYNMEPEAGRKKKNSHVFHTHETRIRIGWCLWRNAGYSDLQGGGIRPVTEQSVTTSAFTDQNRRSA
jgi:hypothetical protein